ncbi:glycosyltransferase [Phycisphaeraceae bacterium D3-23]
MSPHYSLIIPAYNEQDQLARTLPLIRDAMARVGQPGELIVVDNNSTDATAQVAREHGAAVVFEPVNQIAKARNAGAKAAISDAFIFVDADTTPAGELLKQAVTLMLDDRAIGGGGIVEMDTEVPCTVRLVLGFWNTVSRLCRLSAGCFFFCQRDAFEEAGGFPESVYASEEIWLGRKLRKLGRQRGKPMTILREPTVKTSARKTDQTFRVAGMMLLFLVFPFAVRWRRFCGYWYKGKETGEVDAVGARSVSE